MLWVDTLLYDIWWLLQIHFSSVNLRATQVVRTQTIATWDMWYINEGFLVWIIPLTYQSRESIIWACTTSFVHIGIYRMFNIFITCLMYLSYVYLHLCSRHHLICMFSNSVLSIYMVYCRFFNFLYFLSLPLPACLNHITWPCTRVPDMHATWLCHMYSRGCIWQPWILISRS